MFGSSVKKQKMMEMLRKAQAKNISIEKVISFENTKGVLDQQLMKEKALKKEKIKRADIANPSVIYEELMTKYENGTPAQKSCIEKLAERASRYDVHKEAHLVQGLESVALDLDNFRRMLKKIFQLEFTNEEFIEAGAIFDRNKSGSIDGTEFRTCFSLLGRMARDKKSEGVRKAEMVIKEKEKAKEDERRARILAKGERAVEFDFTVEEGDKALQKYLKAALNYDRMGLGAMGLTGFDQKFLSPATFRELLKLTFNLLLNNKELGAIIKYVEPEFNGVIHSGNFLKGFLRSGVEQRNEALLTQLKASKDAEMARIAHAKKLVEDLEASKELGVDMDFNEKEKEDTMERLHKAAVKYNKNHPSALGLDGFTTKALKPGAFREMVKRTFNLVLDKKDIGVLLTVFGNKDKTMVECEKFTLHFIRQGIKMRQVLHKGQVEKQRDEIKQRAEEELRKLEAQWKALEKGFDPSKFTEKDQDSADKKLRYAAFKFEKGGRGVPIESFNCRYMEPGVFRELSKRIFNFVLTQGELAALVTRFGNGNGKVDCGLFMTQFGRLGTIERDKARAEKRELARNIELKMKTEGPNKTDDMMKAMNEQAIDEGFTKSDVELGLAKLKNAAHHATFKAPSFDTKKMSPGLLRMMLKRTFLIELTPRELTGITKPYRSVNDNNEVEIDVKKFMIAFMAMATDVKSSSHSERIHNNRKAVADLKGKEKEKADHHKNKMKSLLTFSDVDRKGLKDKLKDSSYIYAVDSASFIVPLQKFKGSALTGPAFRDIFYTTFLIRLTMSELGLLMDVLDQKLATEHMLSGDQFLRGFFKLGRLQERVLLGELKESDVHPLQVMEDTKQKVSALPPVETSESPNKKRGKGKGKPGIQVKGASFLSTLADDTSNPNPWKKKFSH
jgi:hypothetical protein